LVSDPKVGLYVKVGAATVPPTVYINVLTDV
jgi:hypothetical protein